MSATFEKHSWAVAILYTYECREWKYKKKAERQCLPKEKDLLMQWLVYKRNEPSSDTKKWRGRLFCCLDFFERQTSRMERIDRNLRDSPVRGSQPLCYPFKHPSNTSMMKPAYSWGHAVAKIRQDGVPAWSKCILCLFCPAFPYTFVVPPLSLFSSFLIIRPTTSYCRNMRGQDSSSNPGQFETRTSEGTGLDQNSQMTSQLGPKLLLSEPMHKAKAYIHAWYFIVCPDKFNTKFYFDILALFGTCLRQKQKNYLLLATQSSTKEAWQLQFFTKNFCPIKTD